MTTPAQYEAAIRWLEEALTYAGDMEPPMVLDDSDRPDIESALAIVREAREVQQENARLRERVSALSWAGEIDRMSGAHDPRDRHEMGG